MVLFNTNAIINLISSSDNLSKYCHVKNALSNSTFLIEQLEIALENANLSYNSDLPLYNFFVNKERKEEINDLLKSNVITFKDIFNSISDITSIEKYCLILNHIECYCSSLNSVIFKEFTKILVENLGKPIGGLDYYCFIGRKDISPPGLHVDHDNTYIFHVGPNSKIFYIWDNYFDKNELSTSTMVNENEIDNIIPYAKKIVLQPNDLLFIPKDIPHYATYEQPSIMFGITQFPFYTDYIWFLNNQTQTKVKNNMFLTSHDTDIEENLFLKYPKFNDKILGKNLDLNIPLPMLNATVPLKEDIRFNKGLNKKTLKPIYSPILF